VQSEEIAGDGFSIDESCGSESRSHGREFIHDNLLRRLTPQQREKNDRRIIAGRFAGLGHSTGSLKVKDAVAMRTFDAHFETAIIVGLRLIELCWWFSRGLQLI
jgi:hypothetical protein